VSSGEAAATMFELYRDRIADRHRVVFFTRLNAGERIPPAEIEAALAALSRAGEA
jgi:hypothetical protein